MDFTRTFVGRPSTVRTYTSLFRHRIEPYVDPEKLNKNSIYWFLDRWKEAGLHPQTVKILVRILKWYLEFHKIPTDHFRQIARNISRDCQTKPAKGLTKEQAERLLATCHANARSFYPILLLGLHTGMRRGEILGLQFGDLDFLRGRIHVRRSYNGPTKTGRERVVPMSEELEKTFLSRYNFNMREEERLFPSTDPNPTLEFLCRQANIPIITCHGLRHTFCTLALEAGVSPKQVADIVGHTRVSTTLDCYWNNIHQEVNLEFLP